jgi:hypothetical protein
MSFRLRPLVLILEKDEVIKTDKSACGWSESQRTYAELGAVEKSWCCFFVCIDSSIGTIIPGWGCNSEVADAIAEELNSRVSARGDATQLRRSEESFQRIQAMESRLDKILVHLANAPQSVSMDDRTDERHHGGNNLENDDAANMVDFFRGIEYARLEFQERSRLETM